MFWDSRVFGLERQAFAPIASREEMRGESCAEADAMNRAADRVREIATYRNLFNQAFPEPSEDAVTPANLARALAAFERSLVTPDTPVDRFLRGETAALSAERLRGLQVFQDAGCIQCHGGPMFSDFKLHFLGVSDDEAHGRRAFRTPTLRNLTRTAPYLHDGSRRTLREVLLFYEALAEAAGETLDGGGTGSALPLDPLLRTLNLNADDFPALESFLSALDSDASEYPVPDQVPSGLPVPR